MVIHKQSLFVVFHTITLIDTGHNCHEEHDYIIFYVRFLLSFNICLFTLYDLYLLNYMIGLFCYRVMSSPRPNTRFVRVKELVEMPEVMS